MSVAAAEFLRRLLLAQHGPGVGRGERNVLCGEIFTQIARLPASPFRKGIVDLASARLPVADQVDAAQLEFSAREDASAARPRTRWPKSRKRWSWVWPRRKR